MATSYAGYMGKVVELDLGTRTSREYPWTDDDRRKYIGGKIMAAKILSDLLTGHEEPFSAENPIIISTGPLTGTGVPCSGRFNISALSPQTGIVASSNCGGTVGYFLKKAGLDATPAQERMRELLEERWGARRAFGQMVIGPAGENLVLYAGAASDERAAGRTGLGAVMGYKNL